MTAENTDSISVESLHLGPFVFPNFFPGMRNTTSPLPQCICKPLVLLLSNSLIATQNLHIFLQLHLLSFPFTLWLIGVEDREDAAEPSLPFQPLCKKHLWQLIVLKIRHKFQCVGSWDCIIYGHATDVSCYSKLLFFSRRKRSGILLPL